MHILKPEDLDRLYGKMPWAETTEQALRDFEGFIQLGWIRRYRQAEFLKALRVYWTDGNKGDQS